MPNNATLLHVARLWRSLMVSRLIVALVFGVVVTTPATPVQASFDWSWDTPTCGTSCATATCDTCGCDTCGCDTCAAPCETCGYEAPGYNPYQPDQYQNDYQPLPASTYTPPQPNGPYNAPGYNPYGYIDYSRYDAPWNEPYDPDRYVQRYTYPSSRLYPVTGVQLTARTQARVAGATTNRVSRQATSQASTTEATTTTPIAVPITAQTGPGKALPLAGLGGLLIAGVIIGPVRRAHQRRHPTA